MAPVICFHLDSSRQQLLFPGRREPVIFELALQILACRLPFGRDPALPFQAMQRRVKGAVLHLQQVIGGALDVLGDLVAVRRPEE